MVLNQTPSTSTTSSASSNSSRKLKLLKSKKLYNNNGETNTTEESRLSESTTSSSSSTTSSGFKSRSRHSLKYFNHKLNYLNHNKRKQQHKCKQQAEQQVPQQPKSTFTNAARNLIKLFSRNKPKKEESKMFKTVKSESKTLPSLGSCVPLVASNQVLKNRLTIGATYSELNTEKSSSNQYKHIQVSFFEILS